MGNFDLVFPAFSFLSITIPHPFCYKSTLEVKIKRSKCRGRKAKLDTEAVFQKKKKPRSAPDRDCAIIPQGSHTDHTICFFNRLYFISKCTLPFASSCEIWPNMCVNQC